MNGWVTAALGDIATIERLAVQPKEIKSGQTYVGLENINSDGGVASKAVGAGELASTKYRFNEKHILYGKLRPYLGKVAYPGVSGICSTDILPILPGPRSEGRYLYHFLRRPETVEYATTRSVGINLPRISPSVLSGIELPLPPLPEQRRIADILDRAEALRAKRREALALLDGLTQAIFLEMFGDPASNPKGWPTSRLRDLTKIGTGSTPNRAVLEHFGGSIPWVKTTEVSGVIYDTEEKLSELGLRASRCRLYPPDSLVVALYGQGKTRGRCARLAITAATNQACGVLLPSDSYNTSFLLGQLELSYNRLRDHSRGGNQENLNLNLLGEFLVKSHHLTFSSNLPAARRRLNASGLPTRRILANSTPSSPPSSTAHSEASCKMTHFAFLQPEWPELFQAAASAESYALPEPRIACFYARRGLEVAIHWLYKHDKTLKLPYQDQLSALLFEPSFQKLLGPSLIAKARIVRDLGNQAVHEQKTVKPQDAVAAVRELFHLTFWLARNYARRDKPPDGLAFSQDKLSQNLPMSSQTIAQVKQLLDKKRESDEKLTEVLAGKQALDEELQRLREEIAAIKKANAAKPDTHDYSESKTRDYFIDLLLKEAGWALDRPQDREYEVSGMPNQAGQGFVDYVLWGQDGKPLGLVEAKRTREDPRKGQEQALAYADCLERMHGQRPIIFYSNGYDHWMWDDANYPPRLVQGFYKPAELELLIQRRDSRKTLADAPINEAIVERYYQTRAIRRIGETLERDNLRKALLVMATGAGKTRTVIALVDLLMRCNWVKRVLFLADRVALVTQAVNAFKKHLPEASPVNLVTEKDGEGRVFVSTYPTMMGLIDDTREGQKRFGPGHFDLIVIDEAHRSVYQKYGAIFSYFDSLLVGLTATPKDEVDRNTYRLFDLEEGVPTDAYSLDDAVKDGFLVPCFGVSVPLKFQREGINYEGLSEDEKEQWDALEWDDEEGAPDRIEAEAVNRWLFNKDTVDKVLEHLMRCGQKVAGGDRLGKTIVFAKNVAHAEFIVDRFNANYPHYKGTFARVITNKTEYAQNLIDNFSQPAKVPHIAVSVDMLDTGIDVPEVVNLVFFKLVRSKTKFWQMLGRGTRLCKDLFGPGQDKKFFYIFDYCQNLEFFSQSPPTSEGSLADSLGKRLFVRRLELVGELDKHLGGASVAREGEERGLRDEVTQCLRTEVAAMNVDNFLVRPQRRLVEAYREPAAWTDLTQESRGQLATNVAGLPSELEAEPEESKRFDLLILNLQLACLRSEPSFVALRDQVRATASLLEEKSGIPMVAEQLPLIQEIQEEAWWEDVTLPMLERVRKSLRALVTLMDKRTRAPIYTDFQDQLGEETTVDLPGFGGAGEFERFKEKARAFLRQHDDLLALQKLRRNRQLTQADLGELERVLAESGLGRPEDLQRAAEQGLGLFVRSLVGLDREAAKEVLGGLLTGTTMTPNQIEFLDLVVEHLTENGVMDPGRLYESPFTDYSPEGPDGLFSSEQVDELVGVLRRAHATAGVTDAA